jgi:hypothetical protein
MIYWIHQEHYLQGHFNTCDCLIKVITWAGWTVLYIYLWWWSVTWTALKAMTVLVCKFRCHLYLVYSCRISFQACLCFYFFFFYIFLVSDNTYQHYIQLMHFDCSNNISTWYIEYTKSITYKVTRFGKSLNDSDRPLSKCLSLIHINFIY